MLECGFRYAVRAGASNSKKHESRYIWGTRGYQRLKLARVEGLKALESEQRKPNCCQLS